MTGGQFLPLKKTQEVTMQQDNPQAIVPIDFSKRYFLRRCTLRYTAGQGASERQSPSIDQFHHGLPLLPDSTVMP
jgi:hypothetical protein